MASLPVAAALLVGQPVTDAVLQETYREAEQAFQGQRLEEAEAGYRKLAELSPGTAEVHAKLGLIHYLQGKFSDAVPAFRTALGIKPGLPNVDALLAVSLAGIGAYSEAIAGLESEFSDPANGELRRLIGLELQRCYSALGRNDSAGRIVSQLEELYPSDPEVLYHTGRYHADMATAAMQTLLKLAPESVWGHQASGDALDSLGNHDLAIVEYRKALAKQPNHPGVHYSIGLAIQASEGRAGTEDEAMDAFREELGIDPSNALAAYELGEILRKQSRLDESLEYFRQAVDQRPGFGLGQIGLGRVLRELEQHEQAREHLQAAVEIAPDNEVARYQLALVYRALGNLEAAEREMREFQRLQSETP